MMFTTSIECYDKGEAAELDASPRVRNWKAINDEYVIVTRQWESDFVAYPMNTMEEREQQSHEWMGRGEAAAVFEMLVVDPGAIKTPLMIADAADRLAGNSGEEDHMALIVEGFDRDPMPVEAACRLLGQVSVFGRSGNWPTTSWDAYDWALFLEEGIEPDYDREYLTQYVRDFGTAIRTMIDDEWSGDIRSRLVAFELMEAEERDRRVLS